MALGMVVSWSLLGQLCGLYQCGSEPLLEWLHGPCCGNCHMVFVRVTPQSLLGCPPSTCCPSCPSQGPWASSPTMCHWQLACSPPSVGAHHCSQCIQHLALLRSSIQPLWGGVGWDGWGELLRLWTYWAPSWPPEPGYYRDGEFGIRIEDIALVVEAQTMVAPQSWAWGGTGLGWGAFPGQGWGT